MAAGLEQLKLPSPEGRGFLEKHAQIQLCSRKFFSHHARLSSSLSAPVSRCCPATSDGIVQRHFLRASQWFASRTVGFIDATPTLLPGTEILWMRLFDQRSDIGMGFMPTKWMSGSLSKFYRRTGFTAEPHTC